MGEQTRGKLQANQTVTDTLEFSQPVRYLTRKSGNAELATSEVRYCISMPEYPESSSNGILHIIDIRGRTRAEVEAMHKDVSDYSTTGSRPVTDRS